MASVIEDDDGPPPLEDMTEYIQSLNLNKTEYKPVPVEQKVNIPVYQVTEVPKKAVEQPAKKVAKKGYGGMKKGFLFGGGGSKKSEPITIKANPKASAEGLKLKEVQETMNKADTFLKENSNTWLNDGLLAEIEKDPVISSKIGNPQFMAAFGEFQQNPAGAMQKYGGNPEMKEFIQRFAGLLGDHFSKLGEQQDQPNEEIQTKNS